ncbi:MAG: hypothetical protein ABII00_15470 [Elusimicrobiota bacterium]
MRSRKPSPVAACVLALAVATPPLARAVEVQPLWAARLLGGQYFFEGEKGTLSGNVSVLVAPALIFNDKWTLLPSLSSGYQGTKQVVDLVGAGSLFQERMDHRVGAKLVHSPEGSRWRFKPEVRYKTELLKETRDERWLKGLFDYQSVGAGVEAEYVFRDPFSVRAGYDYSYTFFPNYNSLESSVALDFQGQPLARELVGDSILDAHIHMITLAAGAPLGRRFEGETRLVFQRRSFGKQRVVESSGLLAGETRRDFVTLLDATVRLPAEMTPDWRLLASLTAGVANAVSNQNSFDALRTRFFPSFYNYGEVHAGPRVALAIGDERQPVACSLGARFSYRRYPYRLVQDASGTYQASALHQTAWTVSATLSYPMAPRFSLLFDLQLGRASSNQGFEQFYSYNYSATSYLFGFSYDY